MAVEACAQLGVEVLTLFAFSSENWQRPADEVGRLMDLFMEALEREAAELNGQGVRVRFIGDRRSLSVRLQSRLNETEDLTRRNQKLNLLIAVGYGGRWTSPRLRAPWRAVARAEHSQPMRSTRRLCRASLRWVLSRIRTCSSAPAVSDASAISCCGTSPTPSSTSATRCGRISIAHNSIGRWNSLRAGSAVSALTDAQVVAS